MAAMGAFTICVRPARRASATGVEPIDVAAIYREHSKAVFRLARTAVGPTAAEDVTQDVFLSLWSRPDRFDTTRGSLRAYLLAITHYRAIDMIRSESARSKRQRRVCLEIPAVVTDIEHEMLERSDGAALRSALRQLKPKAQEAITIAFFGGLTYREVAVTLGEPEGTIKSRIRDGLMELRSILEAAELADAAPPAGPRVMSQGKL
jgi:RNA polymerase sigma-70 factor, ECF subfamily